jgi:hypothetical protein
VCMCFETERSCVIRKCCEKKRSNREVKLSGVGC